MNNNNAQSIDEIMLTRDVLARYKISRSTLYFWSTPARMPSSFKRLFPQPTIGGSPKRWRKSEILLWEEEVNAEQVDSQQRSQDVPTKFSTNGIDLPDSHADCNEP